MSDNTSTRKPIDSNWAAAVHGHRVFAYVFVLMAFGTGLANLWFDDRLAESESREVATQLTNASAKNYVNRANGKMAYPVRNCKHLDRALRMNQMDSVEIVFKEIKPGTMETCHMVRRSVLKDYHQTFNALGV